MKKERFSIKKNETVTGHLWHGNKLIAQVYDSGFRSNDDVLLVLIRKIPYTPAKVLKCEISTESGKWCIFNKKVNK